MADSHFCPNCSQQVPPTAAECPRCGALFDEDAAWSPVSSQGEPIRAPAPPEKWAMPTMHEIADWWGGIKYPYRRSAFLLAWVMLFCVTGLFWGSFVAVLLFDLYTWVRRDD